MKTNLKSYILMLGLVATASVMAESKIVGLNPVEKNTVKVFDRVMDSGRVNDAVVQSRNLQKDTAYLSTNSQENAIAKNAKDNSGAVMGSVGNQVFKALFGRYEDEIKSKWLTLDLSADNDEELSVESYDRENFELTMKARRNNKHKNSLAESSVVEEKGKWRLKPKFSSHNGTGAVLSYLNSQVTMELKVTTNEKIVNVQRSLKTLAVDTRYNIDLSNNKSSVAVSKSLGSGLSVQMEKIGNGVSAFSGSEDRVSLNFGQAF